MLNAVVVSYCGYLHAAIRYTRACKDLSIYSQDMTKRVYTSESARFLLFEKENHFLCFIPIEAPSCRKHPSAIRP